MKKTSAQQHASHASHTKSAGRKPDPRQSEPSDQNRSGGAGRAEKSRRTLWYAGEQKDMVWYLLLAVLFIEMIVGGVSFFYGLVHAAPEQPGGPPVAHFPWLVWALASVLSPVGLLLVVHLTGRWLSHTLEGQEQELNPDQIPERLQRFYAAVRNAPTVVLLLGILLLGAGLFFVDGAFSALGRLGVALLPFVPWIVGSMAGLLVLCYVVHRWFIYRHHKLEQEYAYRREVLERTGIVLMDRGCVPLPQTEEQRQMLGQYTGSTASLAALPPVLDVEGSESGPDSRADNSPDNGPDNAPDDHTDSRQGVADVLTPEEGPQKH